MTDAGKPFVMSVPYDAYPRADTEWFFEGTSLPVQNIDTSADKTEYRLKSPSKEDQGQYKVVIKNKHGEAEALINLDVIGESMTGDWIMLDSVSEINLWNVRRVFKCHAVLFQTSPDQSRT